MTRRRPRLAQAKINLCLRVLAREASGYHSIETVFLRLDLGDDGRGSRLRRAARSTARGPTMPAAGLGPIERNLAYPRRGRVRRGDRLADGFAIEIEKRIPVGGGLGGGSADAGAVLRALDALVADIRSGSRLSSSRRRSAPTCRS